VLLLTGVYARCSNSVGFDHRSLRPQLCLLLLVLQMLLLQSALACDRVSATAFSSGLCASAEYASRPSSGSTCRATSAQL